MEKGYYIKSRSIANSLIAKAPPCVREVWDYLLRRANYEPAVIGGHQVERGSLLTSYKEIQEDLSWNIGFRKCTYTKHQIDAAMKWVVKHGMVTTMRTARKTLVTICKYSTYQDPSFYESRNESRNEHRNESRNENRTITKERRTKKEEKRNTTKQVSSVPSLDEVEAYFLENGFTTESAREAFKYYNEPMLDRGGKVWKDSRGNTVISWKQKMRAVWFKDENKINRKNGTNTRWEKLSNF